MATSTQAVESFVKSSPAPLDAWYTRCPTATAFSIAIQLGWVAEEFRNEPGITFRALQTSKDPKVHLSHYTHTQKNSFRHGGCFPALYAQSSGSNIRLIGLSWSHSSAQILALPDSPIRTAADLKGKRLLVLRRPKGEVDFIAATALRTYEAALASVGLSFDDVTIVNHAVDRTLVSDRVQHGDSSYVTFAKNRKVGRNIENIWGLLKGEADVIVGGDTLIEVLGLQTVFDSSTLPVLQRSNNSTPQTFAVSAELLEERPDFVARVYARALQAVEWARNNRSEAIRIVAREQARTEQQVEDAYGERFLDTLEVGLDPHHIEALKYLKDFALRHGFIPKDFDVAAWIDPRPLEAAKALVEERRSSPVYRAEVAPRLEVIRK
ncbi:MAG TPA: ABC transporter substrate-binding protein [Steroidobacteraceae bacterium]|nr:ABC transporter substrate-binding protein [Steroidobacteraceae bacterium]